MQYIGRIFKFVLSHKKIFAVVILILAAAFFFLRPKQQQNIETYAVKKGDLVQSISVTGKIDSQKSVDLNFPISGKVVYLGVKKGDRIGAFQTVAVLDQRTVQKNLENTLRDYSKQRNKFDQTEDDYQDRKPYQALNDSMRRILENNQYDLEKAVISVELQDLAKQQAVLITPISGIVTRADIVSSGTNISAAATFTVSDNENLVFNMEVDEADIGRAKIGQEVIVNLDAFPNNSLKLTVGSIDFASHTTSTGGNAFTVGADLFQNSGNYRMGMNGDAEIITDESKNTLIIPISSIFNNDFVYVKTKTGFEKRKIKLGLQNDTQAEVEEGLREGEAVVLQPSAVPQNGEGNPFIRVLIPRPFRRG